nr:MAG TPA: hypothetical protein [Caudoviricetes sp.]
MFSVGLLPFGVTVYYRHWGSISSGYAARSSAHSLVGFMCISAPG